MQSGVKSTSCKIVGKVWVFKCFSVNNHLHSAVFIFDFTGSHPGKLCVHSAACHHVWSAGFACQASR